MPIGKLKLGNVRRAKEEYDETKPVMKFDIIRNGKDVVLNYPFLKDWCGHKASEMAIDHDGRRTLRWMLEAKFPDALKTVLEKVLDDSY